MSSEVWYYIAATVLLLVNLGCWGATLFTLPGNWGIVLATALFAAFVHDDAGHGIGWWTVGVIVGLAALAEVLEVAAGAAGAAKHGGSRRGMILAVIGAMLGSLAGAALGSPIPVVGLIIGALGGGSLGAFLGAWLGETWKGRTSDERLAISTAALTGRLLGTFAKLLIGIVLVVIATVDSFW